ncbi:hypothetical protein [Methylobacterium sp. R2-1]|uniref:hypothetical protein n=1 Tax=Methylobacterium sp. R2-1 TaxID=2587064 RepID=UPI00160F85F5|nr:hypothetical protein [Methylobacterium sp. R2-1]MBB2965008.1 hypothetical protein [Methylobacterium sp. R2-1]
MAKPARAFQMPAEDAIPASAPAPAPEASSEPVRTAPAASPAARPQYRAGKKNLSVWLDQKAFNSFKAMVAQDGFTMQDYMIDLVNREFARKGLPQIAK